MIKPMRVVNTKIMRNIVVCRTVQYNNFNLRDDDTVFSRCNIDQLLHNWRRFYRHTLSSTEIWTGINNYAQTDGI